MTWKRQWKVIGIGITLLVLGIVGWETRKDWPVLVQLGEAPPNNTMFGGGCVPRVYEAQIVYLNDPDKRDATKVGLSKAAQFFTQNLSSLLNAVNVSGHNGTDIPVKIWNGPIDCKSGIMPDESRKMTVFIKDFGRGLIGYNNAYCYKRFPTKTCEGLRYEIFSDNDPRAQVTCHDSSCAMNDFRVNGRNKKNKSLDNFYQINLEYFTHQCSIVGNQND
jgi:hypothetical protein